jgi:hypothetical protein
LYVELALADGEARNRRREHFGVKNHLLKLSDLHQSTSGKSKKREFWGIWTERSRTRPTDHQGRLKASTLLLLSTLLEPIAKLWFTLPFFVFYRFLAGTNSVLIPSCSYRTGIASLV